MLLVALGVALVAGVIDDVWAHQRLSAAQERQRDTRAALAAASSRLGALTRDAEHTARQRNAARVALDDGRWDLAATRSALVRAGVSTTLLHFDIGTVSACLSGVQQALDRLGVGSTAGATTALSSVSGPCQRVAGAQTGGPTYPFDFADPFVVRVGTTYYAFGTNSASGHVQVMRSTTLTQWQPLGDALPHLARWATPGYTWSPAVVQVGSAYRLYYAVALQGGKQCISVASAPDPQGPYIDTSKAPLVCQGGGSIDPDPYWDGSGHLYLAWRGQDSPGSPSIIWSRPLNHDGTGVGLRPARPLLAPGQRWEDGVVEAPAMALVGGTYWLLYSGNDWNTASYAIGVARCAGPLGPCAKVRTTPMLRSQPGMSGPGSPALFTDAAGHLDMAFAAWLPGAVGYPHARLLFVRQVMVAGGTVKVVAPGP